MPPLACVVLAAGQGVRMKSRLPKPLHEVCGRPMIDHVLETLAELRAERTVVVLGREADQVRKRLPEGVEVAEQAEQLGTGHALMCAAEALPGFEGDLLVTCADIPLLTVDTLRNLIEHHRAEAAAATILTTEPEDPTGYGRIVRDQSGAVTAIVEHADADEETRRIGEINTSVYCFDVGALLPALERIEPANAQGEYYLTDAIAVLVEEGQPVRALVTPDADEVMGINTRVQLAEAERIARERIRERLMLDGVTLLDPPSTLIDAGVSIGRDTVVHPGAQLTGETSVGEDCIIGASVALRGATLGDGVLVRDSCVISESSIGSGSAVGPFTYVREGSEVGEGCKLGSSAEVNRSRVGSGTKMQHFSYLGDSEVGANCNIGAGAVTCNYDGLEKHKTIIEDAAFIGTNVTLIAPVRIGAGAYIAAGSVITKDVPGGALGVSRDRQKNLEGWVERWRRRRGNR